MHPAKALYLESRFAPGTKFMNVDLASMLEQEHERILGGNGHG